MILGIKYLFPYQGLSFRDIRDLEIGPSAHKYLFCIFFAFICLSITNFSYVVGWPVGGLEILNGLPSNKSLRRHIGFLIRSLKLFYLGDIRLILIREAGLDLSIMWAKRTLNGPKDDCTHRMV